MRKIRMGMVGGGDGAFIGAVHRIAAAMDSRVELVCGCFSGDPERALSSGQALGLETDRVYSDYHTMMGMEAALAADRRMDFVTIVTPNHLHLPVAKAAFEQGFHVLSDKPATLNLAEMKELMAVAESSGKLYGLTHTYLGYPMVQEARQRVERGELGTIRKLIVEYSQGWLAAADDPNNKQAAWRIDPRQAGESCCMADIGSHAFNLAEAISGLKVTELCADIGPLVPGRQLDDDGTAMLRFDNGARGVLIASQVSVGEENNLQIRIYGDRGGLQWQQEQPNSLKLMYNDQPAQIVRTGWSGTSEASCSLTRTPAGHPEGYLEAFANLYLQFAERIAASEEGRPPAGLASSMPGLSDAYRGMAFIEAVVAASAGGDKWHSLKDHPGNTEA